MEARARSRGCVVNAAIVRLLARRLAQSGERGAARGIRAFHGSPHDFDRFSLSQIGTGEGAQAYGHGLYFAENEAVARGYRDALAPPHNLLEWRGQPWSSGDPIADIALMQNGGDVKQTLRVLADNMRYNRLRQLDYAMDPAAPAPTPEFEKWRSLYRALRPVRGAKMRTTQAPSAGRMYEVRINAKPGDFLDWDAPLRTQNDGLRDAFVSVRRNRRLRDRSDPNRLSRWSDENNGMLAYDRVKAILGDTFRGGERATDALREAGIPGIRYLDQGSRAAGEGSRNYVVFDDALIEILRKYSIAGLGVGAGGALGLREALRERMT